MGRPGWLPIPCACVYHAYVWLLDMGDFGNVKGTNDLSIPIDSALIPPTTGHNPVASGSYPSSLQTLKVHRPAIVDPVRKIIAELARHEP